MENELVKGILNILEDKLRELDIRLPAVCCDEEIGQNSMDDVTREMNSRLYNRIEEEFNEFISRLMLKSPKEIIDASYEKVMKEEFEIHFWNSELSYNEAKAMLDLEHPLDAIYREWLRDDSMNMSDVPEYIKAFAQKISKEPIVGYHYAELHDRIKEYLEENMGQLEEVSAKDYETFEAQPSFVYKTDGNVEQSPWKIWFETYNASGEKIGAGVRPETYMHKSSAQRKLKQLSSDENKRYVISKTNPFVEMSEPDIER